jgi:signal transduction histidine kinase
MTSEASVEKEGGLGSTARAARPPATEQSFAEWHRDFTAGRLRLLCALGLFSLASYTVNDALSLGWTSSAVGYRAASLLVVGTYLVLLQSRIGWVRRQLGAGMVIVAGAVVLATLQTIVIEPQPDLQQATLTFNQARFGVTLVILAAAVIVPANWPAHLVLQGLSVLFVALRMPVVMRMLSDSGGLTSRALGMFWVFLFCDVSILVFTRLQRSEHAALSGLRNANVRLSDAVGQLARFAERRKLYLDGLVRVGVSATGDDPAHQVEAILDETVRLLDAERAFLYLLAPDGKLVFRAGRSSAGEDVASSMLTPEEDALHLPLTVRDRSLGEIRVERPANHDVDAMEGEGDFLLALASHAAITITTVESAEALRAARDEAVEAARAKDTFLRVMGHELRTPLNAIIGYTEVVAEELEDEGRTDLVADTGKVLQAARRLNAMIVDILDLTAMDAERGDAEPIRFSVCDLVTALVEEATPAAEANGNRLELSVGEHTGSLTTDRERLATVLRKILDNACKFTRDGEVSITARRLGGEGEESLRFEIADSGIGLDEEQRRRCFEPFWQADDSSTREFEGSGLGLTTAERLCTALGGSIEVSARAEGGSLFVVTVPAMRRA